MSLRIDEIAPGIVAYLDPRILLQDSKVFKPQYPTPPRGQAVTGPVKHPLDPFVCFEAGTDLSAWAPLTRQEKFVKGRQVRLPIDRSRRTGSEKWLNEPSFLNDGATTYVGPHEAFIAAAARETPFTETPRPRILPVGIAEILNEVMKRGGRRLVL